MYSRYTCRRKKGILTLQRLSEKDVDTACKILSTLLYVAGIHWTVSLISNSCPTLLLAPWCSTCPTSLLIYKLSRPGGFLGPSLLPLSLDLCFPEALPGAPHPWLLPLPSPSSPHQVFCSSWVLIEMANSRDRAYSQLCQPPLPGAGGRKQNPSNVWRATLFLLEEGIARLAHLVSPGRQESRLARGTGPSFLSALGREAPDLPCRP